MGAPERKAVMESEKMKQSEEGGGGVEMGESPRDQLAWAQYMHDAQYFDIAAFSPRGLITPRDSTLNGFPDLSAICPSPLFADQWKFLQSWSSPRPPSDSGAVTSAVEQAGPVSSGAAPVDHHVVLPAPMSVSDRHVQADVKPQVIQSLDLSRVSNGGEPAASTSVTTSCESEGPCSSSADVKLLASTAESTAGSGDTKSRSVSRKRKSAERDDEELEAHVDNASDAEEIDDSKDKKSRSNSKQLKVKAPKRLREPRYAIKTRTEVDIMEDGYKWRKYGQKPVKNSPHPRNYYRCTTPNCPVRKRVERSTEDPGLVVTSYEGTHTHPKVNQPKRTASGHFAPVEAAESLSESLNQLQSRQQQAAASASSQLPQVPNLFGGFPGSWPMPNRQLPSVPAAPTGAGAMQDNVGLMMAYQIVRLQWELQSKIQQFISYNAQGGLAKMSNPFMDPFGGFNFQQPGQPGLPMIPDLAGMMSSSFGGSSDSDAEIDQRLKALPKVPEALSGGSGSLLQRRAAQRAGSPLNPNIQSNALMTGLQQMMAGLQQQQAAFQQQQEGNLGEAQTDPSDQR